jgi:hypothetical protein
VTLVNSGTTTLQVSSVQIGGADPSDFTPDNGCTGASVQPHASCTVNVTFTPSAAGPRTATLSFNDNANTTPSTVMLSGTGVSAVAAQVQAGPQSVTTTTTTTTSQSLH